MTAHTWSRRILPACGLAAGWIALVALAAAAPAPPAGPALGVLGLATALDAGAGWEDVADDPARAAAAGISLATLAYAPESDFSDLNLVLGKSPGLKARYEAVKAAAREDLAWPIFYYAAGVAEVRKGGAGKLRVLVGPLYDLLVPDRKSVDAAAVGAFVGALAAAEKEAGGEAIAGWLLSDDPLATTHRHDPAQVVALAAALRAAEKQAGIGEHPCVVGLSLAAQPALLLPFLAGADVLLIAPDAFLFSSDPPGKVENAVYESIPHAVRAARELADQAKKKALKVHLALQAFDRVEDEVTQPSHLEMHQQLRQALSPAIAGRGPYARSPKPVPPADALWFAYWRDARSRRSGKTLNRWDDPAGANWSEALAAERAGAPGAVHVVKDETWSGVNRLAGDVIVHKGATLTVEPGTLVLFSPVDHFLGGQDKTKCELVVEGKLVIRGNEQMNVLFGSDAPNPGFSTAPRKPQRSDWVGIRLAGGTVEGKHYKLEYAISDRIR